MEWHEYDENETLNMFNEILDRHLMMDGKYGMTGWWLRSSASAPSCNCETIVMTWQCLHRIEVILWKGRLWIFIHENFFQIFHKLWMFCQVHWMFLKRILLDVEQLQVVPNGKIFSFVPFEFLVIFVMFVQKFCWSPNQFKVAISDNSLVFIVSLFNQFWCLIWIDLPGIPVLVLVNVVNDSCSGRV